MAKFYFATLATLLNIVLLNNHGFLCPWVENNLGVYIGNVVFKLVTHVGDVHLSTSSGDKGSRA